MFATSALLCFVMGCLPEDTNTKQRSAQGAQDPSVKTGPGTHTCVGSSVSYGSHTQYSGGNSGNRYGNSTYYSDGDVGNRFGEVVCFKSGGHSVDNGDLRITTIRTAEKPASAFATAAAAPTTVIAAPIQKSVKIPSAERAR